MMNEASCRSGWEHWHRGQEATLRWRRHRRGRQQVIYLPLKLVKKVTCWSRERVNRCQYSGEMETLRQSLEAAAAAAALTLRQQPVADFSLPETMAARRFCSPQRESWASRCSSSSACFPAKAEAEAKVGDDRAAGGTQALSSYLPSVPIGDLNTALSNELPAPTPPRRAHRLSHYAGRISLIR